jgi:hypothetical protein
MFAIFNFAIIGYSWLLLKETRGKSLEEMEVVFGTVPSLKYGDEDERVDSLGEPAIESGGEQRGKQV